MIIYLPEKHILWDYLKELCEQEKFTNKRTKCFFPVLSGKNRPFYGYQEEGSQNGRKGGITGFYIRPALWNISLYFSAFLSRDRGYALEDDGILKNFIWRQLPFLSV